ncbi:hypothetical protein GGX14DRAFT_601470 [Mycena pura]|uniref:Uncharacterized protein n=1 Tax=Mycena pura TaxID=153505 RepID=A0AAD6UN32_9AGAR|nr:hypothetical protein GGX14DRAFT_601470 [Mycena pura]
MSPTTRPATPASASVRARAGSIMSMDSTTDAIPPTTHVIPPPDRQRLVRSIRKIKSLLGETPVVEALTTQTKTTQFLTPASAAGIFRHASASLSSLALPFQRSEPSPSPSRPHTPTLPAPDRPRPSLVLRVPDIFEPPPSPLSPGFGPTPPSPLSESEAEASSPRAHRLRLAKVTRTLGERIPPALVAAAPRARVTRWRRPSMRTAREASATLEQGDAPVPVPAQPAQKRRPSFRAESFISMTPDPAPTAPPSPRDESVPSSPLGEVHVHPVQQSPESLSGPPRAFSPVRDAGSRAPAPAARPDSTAFATLGVPVPTTHEERHGYSGPFVATAHRIPQLQPPPYHAAAQAELEEGPRLVQRRENSWTGEWVGTVGNMDDVMRQLRGLKR